MSTTAISTPARDTPRSGFPGWIARHPIAAFMAWLFTVGQAIAFTPLVVDTPVPDQVFVIATSVFGLFLPP